jgi:predicted metal-dependent HD superfamily phosphohydrolase
MKLQTLAALSTLYGESHRHYHNLNHIHTCLAEYDTYCKEMNVTPSSTVTTAIWWHDSIYNPYSKNNEWESATLFYDSLEPTERHWAMNDVIREIILMTAKHTEDQTFAKLPDHEYEAKLMLDLDLSSLAAPENVFHKNSDDIRKEFHFIDDTTFLQGRRAFLLAMLRRKRIFYTDYFFEKYEEKARANLQHGRDRAKMILNGYTDQNWKEHIKAIRDGALFKKNT